MGNNSKLEETAPINGIKQRMSTNTNLKDQISYIEVETVKIKNKQMG